MKRTPSAKVSVTFSGEATGRTNCRSSLESDFQMFISCRIVSASICSIGKDAIYHLKREKCHFNFRYSPFEHLESSDWAGIFPLLGPTERKSCNSPNIPLQGANKGGIHSQLQWACKLAVRPRKVAGGPFWVCWGEHRVAVGGDEQTFRPYDPDSSCCCQQRCSTGPPGQLHLRRGGPIGPVGDHGPVSGRRPGRSSLSSQDDGQGVNFQGL